MIILPNNCRCSDFSIRPEKWDTKGADMAAMWYIRYRFYTPSTSKQVVIKGFNRYADLSQRQKMMRAAIAAELEKLHKGMNPITKKYVLDNALDIAPSTPFIVALRAALTRLTVEKETYQDINNVIDHTAIAAGKLRLVNTPIGAIKRRDIKACLGCLKTKTANNFNHHRRYLSMVFKELLELEAVESNPVKDIAKQKTVKKIREILSPEDRQRVSAHLRTKHPAFWRYINIFFHSGCRTTELLKMKGKDINLAAQTFKVTIIKGSQRREVNKVIKDVALPYWHELKPQPDEYVFSKGLQPGSKPIRPEQITRRWRRLVMQPLGITATFYSMKHLASDETARLLSIEHAQRQNSHTGVATTRIYAINERERENEQIRKLGNEF